MRYLLDTSFAIDYLRGQGDAIARMEQLFADGDDVFVNDVVICELATGMASEGDPRVQAFIRALEYLQPGPEVAAVAGGFRSEARRRGQTLSVPDALIAACADSVGALVLTRNVRDFALTPVRVATY
ncbi:MAG TPA: type II toxin-antitoxin system VapC family toxin [Candidatus Limnocylindria bacterium]|nr:type II toxin-antitoxin system VapC family toxin [Candidatus Limnocylindria bacterium]